MTVERKNEKRLRELVITDEETGHPRIIGAGYPCCG